MKVPFNNGDEKTYFKKAYESYEWGAFSSIRDLTREILKEFSDYFD